MLKLRVILFLSFIVCGRAWALEEFEGIHCGSDIPKLLAGKRSSSGSAAALEQRHKDLGLKNLGGDEISDSLFLASWQICGAEYELLVNTKTDLIRDVLPFLAHSASAPMFIGKCQSNGKETGTLVAVLNNSAHYNAKDEKQAKAMLKATSAWKIDAANEKFVSQAAEALACPLGGIVTQDGGP